MSSETRKVIYVSGAYTNPDLGQKFHNVLEAWQAAQRIWKAGHIAICPHANTFLMGEADRCCDPIDFVGGDLVIIERCCDALYMLQGWPSSAGAKEEREHARAKNMPVFYSDEWDKMLEWMNRGDDA